MRRKSDNHDMSGGPWPAGQSAAEQRPRYREAAWRVQSRGRARAPNRTRAAGLVPAVWSAGTSPVARPRFAFQGLVELLLSKVSCVPSESGKGREKNPLNFLQAGGTAGPEQRRGRMMR